MEKSHNKPVKSQPYKFGPVLQKIANMFKAGHVASVSAGGITRGGYHLTGHSHKSRTFKANQRLERKLSRRRKMKPSAR